MFRPGDVQVLSHPHIDVNCIALANNQTLTATGCGDGRIFLWEPTEACLIAAFEGVHEKAVNSLQFNRDGTLLISAGEDGKLVLWDLTAVVGMGAGGREGRRGATRDDEDDKGRGGEGGAPRRVSVRHRVLAGHEAGTPICFVVMSPSNTLFATGAKDMDVMVWGTLGRPVCNRLRGHNNWVSCGVFAGVDHNVLITGGFDHAMCLWNMTGFSIIRTVRCHVEPVTALAVSAEGSVVMSGDLGGTVLIWRFEDGAVLRELLGHKAAITGVCIASKSGLLLSCSRDWSLKVWSMRGRCARSIKMHDGSVLGLCVDSLEKFLVTCGDDGKATLMPFVWDEAGDLVA